MKIDGKITLLINVDKTRIEIYDSRAAISILSIELTPEQLSSALSRIAHTSCDVTITNRLDLIGKRHENSHFKMRIPKEIFNSYSEREDKALKIIQEELDSKGEGWIADRYLGSQNSFIYDGEDGYYVNAIIRRWV